MEKLSAGDFDLVFTDLRCPKWTAGKQLEPIRKRWPDMRIVMVTGYGSTTPPPQGEENLVDGIIGKPFDFTQVGSMLTALTLSSYADTCLKRQRPESFLVEVHYSRTGSKSNSKSHDHCWPGPIILICQHETCRCAREVSVLSQDFVRPVYF